MGRAVGVRDEILFATERTGLIVAEMNLDIVSDNDLDDWNNAIDEYFYFSEKGIDPYHVFTYLDHDDFDIYKRAISFLDDIIVICFSVMNRTKVTRDVSVQFHF